MPETVNQDIYRELLQDIEQNGKRYRDALMELERKADTALKTKDVHAFLDLREDLRKPELKKAARLSQIPYTILSTIQITTSELEQKKELFIRDVESVSQLLNKVKETSLYIHRFEFDLPEDAMNEARNYLEKSEISLIACEAIVDSRMQVFGNKNKLKAILKNISK